MGEFRFNTKDCFVEQCGGSNKAAVIAAQSMLGMSSAGFATEVIQGNDIGLQSIGAALKSGFNLGK